MLTISFISIIAKRAIKMIFKSLFILIAIIKIVLALDNQIVDDQPIGFEEKFSGLLDQLSKLFEEGIEVFFGIFLWRSHINFRLK